MTPPKKQQKTNKQNKTKTTTTTKKDQKKNAQRRLTNTFSCLCLRCFSIDRSMFILCFGQGVSMFILCFRLGVGLSPAGLICRSRGNCMMAVLLLAICSSSLCSSRGLRTYPVLPLSAAQLTKQQNISDHFSGEIALLIT